MDHRWDEMLQAEHRRRVEQSRYDNERIATDRDVERRDQLAAARTRVHKSPWEIGASHWDQRDLYTRNNHTDESGYARGPSVHPDTGSYAYHREAPPPPSRHAANGPSIYEREARPWLNYERLEQGPKGWRRPDESIREDACERLTVDHHLDAREVEVAVKDGEITLTGTVPDRGSKRRAELLVEHLRGVTDVHNQLTIKKKDDDDLAFTAPIAAF
jgi:hypothetical protein